MDLNDLRRKRKAAADDMAARAQALTDIEAGEGVTEAAMTEAQAAFEAAEAAFKALDVQVKRAETVEAAQAASAQSETTAPAAPNPAPGQTAPAAAANPEDRGVDVGLMMAALAARGGDRQAACDHLEQAGHSGISAALSGATDGAGGVTIPRAQAQTMIELLQPRVALERMGIQRHDMPAGELRNARVASGPTASYGAENAATAESEPTFDAVQQNFKTLSSLVPIGNALLRHSSASVGLTVRNLMLDAMGLKKDIALIRYDGTGDMPKGLLSWALAGHKQAAVANTVAAVENAIHTAVNVVEESNVMMLAPGWIMRPGTKNFLASLRHPDTGFRVFPSIRDSNELEGYPLFTTTQIPNNLGAGTNETEIYFLDASEIMLGSSQTITIASSTEAAFVDSSGDTISAFQRNLTLMRAVEEHDMAPAHDEAIAVINGVAWSL
jgi:HK97 family phage major capsid protein